MYTAQNPPARRREWVGGGRARVILYRARDSYRWRGRPLAAGGMAIAGRSKGD